MFDPSRYWMQEGFTLPDLAFRSDEQFEKVEASKTRTPPNEMAAAKQADLALDRRANARERQYTSDMDRAEAAAVPPPVDFGKVIGGRK